MRWLPIFASALRRAPVLAFALFITPSLAQVVLLIEESASIYRRAAKGFEASFDNAAPLEVVYSDTSGKTVERLAPALRRQAPHLIVAIGTQAAVAAQRKFPGTPVLYCLALDPVRNGLTGPNIGGLNLDVDVARQMVELQRVLPNAKRIGVIYNEPVSGRLVDDAVRNLKPGTKLVRRDVRTSAQAAEAIETLAGHVDAFWLLWDPVIANSANFRRLVEFCLRNKIALVAPASPFVEAGALLSIGADYFETGRRAGALARDIVNGRTSVSDIGREAPAGPLLTINNAVARQIGLIIPRDVQAEILSARIEP